MKALILFAPLIILLPINATSQVKQYKIQVVIKNGLTEGKAFIRYFTDRGRHLDSVNFNHGQFTVTGNVPKDITIAKIYLREENKNEDKENSCDVWLEPGTIKITVDKKLLHAKYSGSAIQKQFSELQSGLIAVKKKNFILGDLYEKAVADKDDAGIDNLLNKKYPALFAEKQQVLGAFIKKYPSSVISVYMFGDFAGDDRIDIAVVEPVYALLPDNIKQQPAVKKVAERISICKRTAPGTEAIDFSQADTSGNAINLSRFRGKYLLIDFWAGWCMPCRAENPHLIRLFTQYNNKGFEILSVSLDGERSSWVKAIVTDQLKWAQVSDLQIFENAVAKLYGITSIPQNILIGPNGKIIAWNLKGSVLDDTLNKLLANN